MENTALQSLLLFLANQHPESIAVILYAMLGSPLAVSIFVLWAWIKDARRRGEEAKEHSGILQAYREDTLKQAQAHETALTQVTKMYLDNVELVKNYLKLADGLHDLIILNTQTITRLCDKVEGNQYCPMVRPGK
jgi:hypothetical protein